MCFLLCIYVYISSEPSITRHSVYFVTGCDTAHIELKRSDKESTEASKRAFETGLHKAGLECEVNVTGESGSLTIRQLGVIPGPARIDPTPLHELSSLCLYVEPNAVELHGWANLRTVQTNPKLIQQSLLLEVERLNMDQNAILETIKIEQKKDSSISTQKCAALVTQLSKTKQRIQKIIDEGLLDVGHIQKCKLCEHVVVISNSTRPPVIPNAPVGNYIPASSLEPSMTSPLVSSLTEEEEDVSGDEDSKENASEEEILKRINVLKDKLKTATGNTFKQKRKRLKRKLKDLQTALDKIYHVNDATGSK